MSVEYRFVSDNWNKFFKGKTQRQTEELISQFLFYRETDGGRGFEILTWEELKDWFGNQEQYEDEYPRDNLIEYLADMIGVEIFLVRRVQ